MEEKREFQGKVWASKPYKVFQFFNFVALALIGLACFLPIVHIFAISLSSMAPIARNEVTFWPVEFTTLAYEYVLRNAAFWTAMRVSVVRTVLGLGVNLLFTILVAYPLSKENDVFPARTRYVFFFFFTMLFSGGIIPLFIVVRWTGLIDTIWALVLPGAVGVFNVILMLNFFRQLPKELTEAAHMDGAGHVRTLISVILPCSAASIATVSLFIMVFHWNEWFTPIIFMNRHTNYPLQTFLRSLLIDQAFQITSLEDVELLNRLSNRTIVSAQTFVGMLPILVVYPFLQKHFTKGVVLGSVKG